MKICAYEVRADEVPEFENIASAASVELSLHSEVPSPAYAHLADGSEGVTILGQGKFDRELLDIWAGCGVKYLSTRTVGFNHIDLEYAQKAGIHVCNANYPPSGVAEYTIMMILMSLRHYKQALWRGQVNDFSLNGLEGRELKDLTVGVMGTGRIGQAVIKLLYSFGCKIVAYDPHPNEETKKYARYVDLDELYHVSDIITLHIPLVESTRNIINFDSSAKMKDGVVIINCARV